MFLFFRPTDEQIRDYLYRQQESPFSYADVGATREAAAPAGYIVDHNRAQLGSGNVAWHLAKQAISEWKMFNFPWLQLCWPTVAIQRGVTVAVAISHFGFWSVNPSRIVYIVQEDRRFGFAYGTLKDHSESGEERFLVEWNETDNSVWYDLSAFSRPNAMLAKLAQPLARGLQKRFRQDSMRAMAEAVNRGLA